VFGGRRRGTVATWAVTMAERELGEGDGPVGCDSGSTEGRWLWSFEPLTEVEGAGGFELVFGREGDWFGGGVELFFFWS